ncbi:MAG: right-handed parallel beta-helix repeat-containing protein [Planctomycetota bacterium]
MTTCVCSLRLLPGSPCIDAGDPNYISEPNETDLDGNPRVIGGRVDMGAYEFQGIQTLYVDMDAPQFGDGTSWATAFKCLQDALLFNAIPPAEIRVAEGIYKPWENTYTLEPPSREHTFWLRNGVTIKGGYAGLGQPNPNARDISLYETILSGDMNGDDEPNFVNNGDNSRHVVTGNSVDATAILDGFTITGGFADGSDGSWPLVNNGAGMYNEDGCPTVSNCTFSRNSSVIHDYEYGGKGAGMYNLRSNPTVQNCTFIGNSTDGEGGGICNEHSSPNVTGCVFSNNEGSGMTFAIGSHGMVTGCSFVNNTAGYGGGIDCEFSSSPVISDCTFTGNVASYDGGGLRCYANCSPEVSNCTFTSNTAEIQHGGGMIIRDGNPNLTGCTFNNNTATQGGGIYTYKSNSLLTDCTFTDNSAAKVDGPAQGGAIYNYDSDLVLTGCTFVGNYAEGGWEIGRGGAVYGERTILSLTDCSFRENSAWHGGAIYSQESGALTLNGCTFSDNTAAGMLYEGGRGGGIYSRTDAVSMLACTFQGNSSEYGGGGVYSEDASLLLTDCLFIANVGRDYHDAAGGGIDIDGPEAALFRCVFSGNSASYGGGMAAGLNTLVVNSTFIGNTVHEGGGAIVGGEGLTLVNCTITGNYCDWFGPGGIQTSGYVGVTLVNSILWGNSLNGDFSETSQINRGNAVISYSCVQGWTGLFGGVGNIGADPCFVDPNGGDNTVGTEDDDLRLLLDSPCIDTGDNTAIPPSVLTDLDGNPRIIGNTVDMGAYEFCGPVYVDDDGPNDPGPGDPQASDPLENGTEDHPFDTIQEGINVAKDRYTVLVRQGSYSEPGTSNCIDFLSKNITLTSEDPTDWDVVDNTIVRGYVQFSGTEDPNCQFTGFKISSIEGAIYGNHTHATISHCNISGNGPCGAIVIRDCDGIISNCLITDNTTFFRCGVYPVVFGCNGLIKNCTIANNLSGVSVGTATIENCIIHNNYGSQLDVGDSETLNISYCNLQGGMEGITGGGSVNWGPGNIDTDPCFIRLGYWLMDEVTLIEGDYHLLSEGWHWNTEGESWTYDYVTSRCMDAGNPASDLGDELMSVPRDPDNTWGVNLRINMGAFGGTAQAGMPPHGWALLTDLNNDGSVNYLDFAYQAQDWLTTAPEQPGDQNRDGVVNKMDLAALAETWLQVTVWVE